MSYYEALLEKQGIPLGGGLRRVREELIRPEYLLSIEGQADYDPTGPTRICSRCHEEQYISQFSPKYKDSHLRDSRCKSCKREQAKAYRHG